MQMLNLFNTNHFTRVEKWIALGLFGFLWIYLFIKAIYLPVLHDELATFYYYIQTDVYLPPYAHWDANNHVLNSFLGSLSYKLFGMSPIALRLPNVLSFALLFFAAFKLSDYLRSSILRWGMLLALTTPPYLLEYLAECRGYGLSIALFLLAIHLFIRHQKVGNKKSLALLLLVLFLATSANLTLIIPSLITIALIGFYRIIENFKTSKISVLKELAILLLFASPFLYLIKFSFALKGRGALYYGGDTGFYDFTVSSLSHFFLGGYNQFIAILLTTLFCISGIYLIYQIIANKSCDVIKMPVGYFPFLLVSSVFSILFLSYGMGVNFPEDRAAMYLYFLFIPTCVFLLNQLTHKRNAIGVIGIVLIYFPVQFTSQINPSEPIFSRQERTAPELFEYFIAQPTDFKFPTTIGGYKTQEFCWYYQSALRGGQYGKIHTNYHINLDADFQLIRDGKVDNPLLLEYYKPVFNDPKVDLTLFERKKKLDKKLIFTEQAKSTPGFINDEYFNILEIEIDSLQNETLYLGAELTLNAQSKPFVSWLSAGIFDEEGNSLYNEYIALDWLRKNWNGDKNNLLQGTLLHDIPEKAKTLKFYIWNIDKTSYSIPNGKCYLYQLKRDFPNQY